MEELLTAPQRESLNFAQAHKLALTSAQESRGGYGIMIYEWMGWCRGYFHICFSFFQ